MKNCETCNIEIDGKFGSGRFCSRKCSCSFSTKEKRKEINEKVKNKFLEKRKYIICPTCGNKTIKEWKKIYCSKKCMYENPSYIKKLSDSKLKLCSSMEQRLRLKEIGRKGGFGKKGYTLKGVKYQSSLEKKCFEFLDSIGLEPNKDYIPHRDIPNSSKISDVYIVHKDLWVEIDGIDREKRKKWIGKDYNYWLEKLEIYKKNHLNLSIIKNINEFKSIIL